MRTGTASWAIASVFFAGLSSLSAAATPLVDVRVSSDTTVALGTTVVHDEDVAKDSLAGTPTLLSVGSIPSAADLDAYSVRANGDQLLSFDTTVVLPGGVTARPGDVVRYNGASYVMEFDAAARGVQNGVDVDALAIYGDSFLLSFDVSVDLNGVHFEDEDLVRFDGATFSMFFDGSAAGVNSSLDLDAVDYIECNDHLLLSFDGSGTIGGVDFDDEDVLEYDRVSLWSMAYDGSVQSPSWVAADLDAVQATVNLGPGPPVVFGQTLEADANKVVVRWSSSVAFRAVRGPFASSTNIGSYSVSFTATGSGTSVSDPSTPAPGTGYWYLVRRGGCIQSSWQSSLGAEPGRDATLP